jgi:hypothetical protein
VGARTAVIVRQAFPVPAKTAAQQHRRPHREDAAQDCRPVQTNTIILGILNTKIRVRIMFAMAQIPQITEITWLRAEVLASMAMSDQCKKAVIRLPEARNYAPNSRTAMVRRNLASCCRHGAPDDRRLSARIVLPMAMAPHAAAMRESASPARSFQDHDVSPRMVNGRSMERLAQRVASVTSGASGQAEWPRWRGLRRGQHLDGASGDPAVAARVDELWRWPSPHAGHRP